MAELTVSATVTRTELELGDLNLDDGINYRLSSEVRVGAVGWRKEIVTSPFVHGRFPVHEVLDSAESGITVYVLGENHATMVTNLQNLLNAFKQFQYTLTIQVEGQTYQWTCERADYEIGFINTALSALVVPVALSFHRHPIPVSGPF